MKRFTILIVAIALILFSVSPAEAAKVEKKYFGDVTDLVVGTSAVVDTVGTINIGEYDWIGFHIEVDVASGGGSGGGTITFEGNTGGLQWTPLWIIEYSDSGYVNTSLTLTSTSDLVFTGSLTFPYDLTDANAAINGFDSTVPLPFEKIRCIVTDTNWNAAAEVDGYYLLKKRQ